MKSVPWTLAGAALLLAAAVLPAAQPTRKGAEAQIRKLDEQIDRERQQQKKTDAEKNQLKRALRETDLAMTRVSGSLSSLRNQRSALLASRQKLMDERGRRQAEQDATRRDLANQLRAAYLMGRNEPLKLLLNQRDPAQFGRNLTYYGYLGRLRADQVNTIAANIVRIDELTADIEEQEARLGAVESKLKADAGELESVQKKRGRIMVNLDQELSTREARLADLRAEREQMDKLLKELSRAAEAAPRDPNSTFARLQGRMDWPVAGRIASNFGSRLRPYGVDIDAKRGAEVRAVHGGTVSFSDYFNNMGNLIVVDHQNGYLTVYAHNDQLFKSAKDPVVAGEKIATVGDTGGRQRPGLYFEIRKDGKPQDPRRWFRANTPPAD